MSRTIRVRVRTVDPETPGATVGQRLRVEDMETGAILPAKNITIVCAGRKEKVEALVTLSVEDLDVAAECVNLHPAVTSDTDRTYEDQLLEALIWCSGSGDFAPGGPAYEGWQKMEPLIKEGLRRKKERGL